MSSSFVEELEASVRRLRQRFVMLTTGLLAVTCLIALLAGLELSASLVAAIVLVGAVSVGSFVAAQAGYTEMAGGLFFGLLAVVDCALVASEGPTMIVPYLLLVLAVAPLATDTKRAMGISIVAAGGGTVATAFHAFSNDVDGALVQIVTQGVLLCLVAAVTLVFSGHNEGLRRDLIRRLQQIEVVVDRAQLVAAGDLQWEVDGSGELASTLQQMKKGLSDLVVGIQGASASVGAAAQQLAAMSVEQERVSRELAVGVDEILRTLTEFSDSSAQIADHTKQVASVASETVQANHLIDEQLRGLAVHTERIKDLLGTINAIANKSDLLALNASLEAVKAGEAGRGFALVAGQMQKLAESVVGSVEDIRSLTADINNASSASLGSSARAAQNAELTSTRASEISLITQQQRSATAAVVDAIQDIAEYTRQSAEASSEAAASVRELEALAASLSTLVDRFELGTPHG